MANRELAVLFDMVKHHCTIVNPKETTSEDEDLYTEKGGATHRDALALLSEAGLARSVDWNGMRAYQLDNKARAAMSEE